MARVAVLGAGIAGLVGAYTLQQAGVEVQVLEARHTPGGMIQTSEAGGYLVEHGPNTIRASTPLLERLIEALGLTPDVMEASDAARNRYVVRDGKPVALPMSPPGLLTTRAFSIPGKLRLLLEPFVDPAPAGVEESVATFVRRRLGAEALAYGADPFVAGIFSGVPANLSVQHAFPALYEMEQTHGSLLRAQWARRGQPSGDAPRYKVFNFRKGLQQFVTALAEAVEPIATDEEVQRIMPKNGRWAVHTTQGWEQTPQTYTVDAVLSTLPLPRLAALEASPATEAPVLAQVPHPPVTVVALGYPRRNVEHPLDGFGMLVPKAESDIRILGTIFTSTIFPDRAPDDHVLLTSLVGGARRPALTHQNFHAVRELVERDLRQLLGVRGEPVLMHYTEWTTGIPQYTVGYGAVKDALQQLEDANARFALAGNYRDGISVPDAMASGESAAQRLLQAL